MVKPQDECIINIKLPDIAKQTLENLSKTNSELNTLLNTINVEGGYECSCVKNENCVDCVLRDYVYEIKSFNSSLFVAVFRD